MRASVKHYNKTLRNENDTRRLGEGASRGEVSQWKAELLGNSVVMVAGSRSQDGLKGNTNIEYVN